MGQYFKLLNLSRGHQITAWDLGGVAKAVEWQHNDYRAVIMYLTMVGADWENNMVILIGDYDSSKLYDISEKWKSIKVNKKDFYNFITENQKKKLYFYNTTKKEYITGTFNQIGICAVWLLAKSDEGGGGDFEDMESAGKWAGDSIITSFKELEGTNLYKNVSKEVFKKAFEEYKE